MDCKICDVVIEGAELHHLNPDQDWKKLEKPVIRIVHRFGGVEINATFENPRVCRECLKDILLALCEDPKGRLRELLEGIARRTYAS